ncbi:cyclophilin-like fold protein [Clostridium sp. MD294]|uniref:flavodoxin n=1 Tax=Clostridium sp. MD294 TaxID=97138 RepID=UPI0002CC08FD|nr:cyclophilin-like fold protein [Clostridium sp. MD294]NDO47008.1 hypothetical protein [Clostridium sp. MD294]USF31241.1 hypothetical protein C820_002687 [Clostridium sp. MD294]
MKKIVSLLLSTAILFSPSACSEGKAEQNDFIKNTQIESTLQKSDNEELNHVAVTDKKNLIVYFSRMGNTEYPQEIDASTSASIVIDKDTFGTTEYVARIIQESVGGDIHMIQTQSTYSYDFNELRNINHKEMDTNFLPPIVESDLNIEQYDTIFIGYPVWASDVPQAVLSFLNEYDLTGKTVVPFCTHDGYGAGRSYDTIKEVSHATIFKDGIAIQSEDILSSKNSVIEWLTDINMIEQKNKQTAITIKVGDNILNGVIYDTALAQEIKNKFPLTISMVGYGNREYYGSVDFYPENVEGGQKTFENGDITYCEAHHNMAIFYSQTDNPILSVDVIPIGKVTSDLSIFENIGNKEEITFSLAE